MIPAKKLLYFLVLMFVDIDPLRSEHIPMSIKLVRLGEDATLTCLIDENFVNRKNLDIVWERPLGTVIGQGAELLLRNIQQVDVGSYICKAVGVIGGRMVSQTISEEVFIKGPTVIATTSPDIVIPQSTNDTVLIFETQNLNLDCKVNNWRREEYDVQWVTLAGVIVSDRENLSIESVVRRKHQGEYVCAIQHRQRRHEIYRKGVTVIIGVPTISIEILPTERLIIGGLIHRRCIGFQLDQSTEKFTYTWMDPSDRVVSSTDTIQVPITSASAQGKYICQYHAFKSGKRFEIITNVTIDVHAKPNEPPYFISILENPNRFRLHERLILKCSVTPPAPEIQYAWYKNNKQIKIGDTVDILTFTKKDFGIYKCHATGRTSLQKKIDLIAYSFQKPNTIETHKVEMIEGRGTQVEVNLHQTKELNCYISLDSGVHGKEVIWMFNGKELRTEEDLKKYRIIREDRSIASILHMHSTNSDNEGRYECIAGSIKKATTIILREEFGELTIHPKIQEDFEGTRSEFHCTINNIPNTEKSDIKWYFVSKEESRRISLPNNRWRTEQSKVIQHTSYILSDSLQMKDNGYIACRLPNGIERRAEIIVKEKLEPFTVKVTATLITVRKLQRFEFECFSLDKNGIPTGVPILKFLNGSLVSSNSQFEITNSGASKIRLVAPSGISIDSNELQISCGVNEKVAIVTIRVLGVCPPHWRYCRNGECIELRKFCDGIMDCPDGSDEDPQYCEACDPIRKPCGTIEGYNSTIPTYNIHRACDGVNDCVNGFDEQNCPVTQKCNTRTFTCRHGLQIPYSYICDSESDCKENEDEIGCRQPTIIKMSDKNIHSSQGSVVKLMCEAVGFPLPKIFWRYNWRCLPDESRMITTDESQSCNSVVSVLTINNFQPGDDALYTCEALSGTERHLSQPIKVNFAK